MPRPLPRPRSRLALWSGRLGLIAAVLTAIGLYLVRGRLVPLEPGLAVLGAGLSLAGIAMVLAVAAFAAIWQSGATGLGAAYAGLLFGLALLAYPAFEAIEALRLPPLTDISTDPLDPPVFAQSRAALERRNGFVPGAYPSAFGPAQRRAYPEVQPVILQSGVEESYRLVQKALAPFRWTPVVNEPPRRSGAEALIEVSAASPVLKLSDDMVIRIRPFGEETRIDIRSASRIGAHDLGSNARRITQVIGAISDLAREN